jgi:hypothetical protein
MHCPTELLDASRDRATELRFRRPSGQLVRDVYGTWVIASPSLSLVVSSLVVQYFVQHNPGKGQWRLGPWPAAEDRPVPKERKIRNQKETDRSRTDAVGSVAPNNLEGTPPSLIRKMYETCKDGNGYNTTCGALLFLPKPFAFSTLPRRYILVAASMCVCFVRSVGGKSNRRKTQNTLTRLSKCDHVSYIPVVHNLNQASLFKSHVHYPTCRWGMQADRAEKAVGSWGADTSVQ